MKDFLSADYNYRTSCKCGFDPIATISITSIMYLRLDPPILTLHPKTGKSYPPRCFMPIGLTFDVTLGQLIPININ